MFELNFGQDTINNNDSRTNRFDIIQFGEGILEDHVLVSRNAYNLILQIRNNDDKIIVQNYFINDGDSHFLINEIRFFDGATWDLNVIKDKAITGTDRNDQLYGYRGINTIKGLDGNDLIYGSFYSDSIDDNDFLIGGDGNDCLYGNHGNDALYGGKGDDYLVGGYSGNDGLVGGFGDDILFGDVENDVLDGGHGNDILTPGQGLNDVAKGGLGDDVYNFTAWFDNDIENLYRNWFDYGVFESRQNVNEDLEVDIDDGNNNINPGDEDKFSYVTIYEAGGNDTILLSRFVGNVESVPNTDIVFYQQYSALPSPLIILNKGTVISIH